MTDGTRAALRYGLPILLAIAGMVCWLLSAGCNNNGGSGTSDMSATIDGMANDMTVPDLVSAADLSVNMLLQDLANADFFALFNNSTAHDVDTATMQASDFEP